MNKSIVKQLIVIAFFVFCILGIFLIYKNKGIESPIPDTQTNIPVEILESANLNSDTPQFRIEVIAHDAISQTPQKLMLINTQTGKNDMELLLSESSDPTECSPH